MGVPGPFWGDEGMFGLVFGARLLICWAGDGICGPRSGSKGIGLGCVKRILEEGGLLAFWESRGGEFKRLSPTNGEEERFIGNFFCSVL